MKPISPNYRRGKPPPAAQPLVQWLERCESLGPLRAGIRQTVALAEEFGKILPAYLQPHVDPGAIKNGCLTIFTAHGALAARLRHLEPALLHDLQRHGWAVETLRIKVKPRSMDEQRPAKQAKVSAVGVECLQQLSAALDPSPLQDALARMAARHAAAQANKNPP
jgi:hypothetical protein